MTSRAALYARTSGDDRERGSLGEQLELCRQYAQDHGYTVVAELAEDERGVSGAVMDPPKLEEALALAQNGRIDVLVVREVDRLARNLAKQLSYRQEFEDAGARIEYVLQQFDASDDGRFMENIHAVIAERERILITRRLKRGRRNKAKNGQPMTHGKAPYGYRLEEDDSGKHALVIDEDQARVVRMVFEWYTKEGLSITAITREISKLGIPTKGDLSELYPKQRGWGKWNRNTIAKILRTETYAGVHHYGKVSYDDNGTKHENPRETWIAVEVPAILSRDTWEATQALLETNRTKGRRPPKYKYLVGRRARCLHCGTSMRSRSPKGNGKIYHYYYCPVAAGRPDYARVCDQRRGFPTAEVDGAVWNWVLDLLTRPEITIKGLQEEQATKEEATRPLRGRLATINNLVTENEANLRRALDLAITGKIAGDLLREKIQSLEETIGGLKEERDRLAVEIAHRTISDQEIATVAEWARQVNEGIDLAATDFATRRQLIEELDLTVTLGRDEDGQPIGRVRCKAAQDGALSIASTMPLSGGRKRQIDPIWLTGRLAL